MCNLIEISKCPSVKLIISTFADRNKSFLYVIHDYSLRFVRIDVVGLQKISQLTFNRLWMLYVRERHNKETIKEDAE